MQVRLFFAVRTDNSAVPRFDNVERPLLSTCVFFGQLAYALGIKLPDAVVRYQQFKVFKLDKVNIFIFFFFLGFLVILDSHVVNL